MSTEPSYSCSYRLPEVHVVKSKKVIYNIFLEPQFSILHEGSGQPKVQLFAGINLQFPKGQEQRPR